MSSSNSGIRKLRKDIRTKSTDKRRDIISEKRENTSDWAIERLMGGDGTMLPDGRQLELQKVYASASTTGGKSTFWEVSPDSIYLTNASLVALAQHFGKKVEVHQSIRKMALQAVLEHCRKTPGDIVVVGGIGSRPSLSNLRKFQLRELGMVYFHNLQENCVLASLINATFQLCGTESAKIMKAYVSSQPRTFTSLKDIFSYLQKCSLPIRVSKLNKEDTVKFLEDGANFVSNLSDGVFLVRIYHNPSIDHCVVVDGGRRLVIDSQQRYPLRLEKELIHKLEKDANEKGKIHMIRKVVLEGKKVNK